VRHRAPYLGCGIARCLRDPARPASRSAGYGCRLRRHRIGCARPGDPDAGIAGDQQAAAIGQACFRRGMIKTTYGTGAFALLNIGGEPAASRHKLLTTVAYRLGGETAYALEGSIFVAGAAVQWLRDRLGAIAEAAEVTILAARADPQERLYLVPGFAGLGAPYWSPHARGGLLGLTAGCGLPEIARAALEAVGYQTRDLIRAVMAASGRPVEAG